MEETRVQALSTASGDTIPSDFVWPEKDQPGISTVLGADFIVPVIDMDDPDDHKLAKVIAKAANELGLFQIVNHGIPGDVIANLQKVGREFFELPQEEKEVCAKEPGSIEGYGTSLSKDAQVKEGTKKGWVDHLFHRVWPASIINYKFWPKNPEAYREATEVYSKYLTGISDKLFRCLSLGLGLEGHEIREAVGGDNLEYMLKINYYPPCPRPDLTFGVPAHTDMSALTLLVPNDIVGLQVCKDERWYNVSYVPNAIIIHIGDQVEVLSNGKYKAVLHRTTVNKERTRMSWPVFLEPPLEQVVGPLPQLVSDENPAKYKSKKYQEFVHCKLNKLPQ